MRQAHRSTSVNVAIILQALKPDVGLRTWIEGWVPMEMFESYYCDVSSSQDPAQSYQEPALNVDKIKITHCDTQPYVGVCLTDFWS